jgi:hypothetical protein
MGGEGQGWGGVRFVSFLDVFVLYCFCFFFI